VVRYIAWSLVCVAGIGVASRSRHFRRCLW
jgi:hypothetical protein